LQKKSKSCHKIFSLLLLPRFFSFKHRKVDVWEDNICISDAQYYELNAQQNLWCEILEFWACKDNRFIHSDLDGLQGKCAKKESSKKPICVAIAPLLHSNSASFIMQ